MSFVFKIDAFVPIFTSFLPFIHSTTVSSSIGIYLCLGYIPPPAGYILQLKRNIAIFPVVLFLLYRPTYARQKLCPQWLLKKMREGYQPPPPSPPPPPPLEGTIICQPSIFVAMLSYPPIAVTRKFVPPLFLFHNCHSCSRCCRRHTTSSDGCCLPCLCRQAHSLTDG